MAKLTSRVQNNKLSVERMTTRKRILLRALNGEIDLDGSLDSGLLLLFVKAFQQLEEAIRTSNAHSSEARSFDDAVLGKHYRALNRLFGRYRLTPILLPDFRSDSPQKSWKFYWAQIGSRQPFVEFAQILTIEQIAAEGDIASLKQCERCENWLFARFSHQRFCSDACKEEFHRSDPADKQRRREWARQNYQLHKTKNVK